MKKSAPVVLALCFIFVQLVSKAKAADLEVSIKDFRSNNGFVLVAVHDDPKAFPKDELKAAVRLKLTVEEARRFVITDLKPGFYAIAIVHDENNNSKLDTNALGLPTEGFGFSNDAMGSFGPPSFDKAKVNVPAEGASTSMKVKHFSRKKK